MAQLLNGDPRREEFHQILKDTLGSEHVYFQPPNNLMMNYPCIVYNRGRASSEFADNGLYRYVKNYEVLVIDRDPDSEIPDKVAALPMSSHERWFAVDNLNHDVFNIYF